MILAHRRMTVGNVSGLRSSAGTQRAARSPAGGRDQPLAEKVARLGTRMNAIQQSIAVKPLIRTRQAATPPM